ncbi:MAG: alpha-1,6-mannanase, partial [Prevotella sp.]|nr:alpha-1,6-mannanase [Prevotella sp.]
MRKLLSIFFTIFVCAGTLSAQTYTYTNEDEWKAYDDFNRVFLDTKKYIYRDHSARENAVDRWNGAAAIWCQAIFYDMVLNAYKRAIAEENVVLKSKYKRLAQQIYKGEKSQYCNFDFDNNNTNTGWFVYDDIMWWTCA